MKEKAKQRILFLDLDGVISSLRNSIVGLKYDPVATLMLKKLQDQIGFKIVISSAQRINHKSAESIIKRISDVTGVELDLHEDWRTVSHPESPLENLPKNYQHIFKDYRKVWKKYLKTIYCTQHWRGHQIRRWLLDHQNEEIDYVVVDDSFDLFPIPVEKVVRIKYGEQICGLTMDHYDQILKTFGKEEEDYA